jgi:hypothetical protein
MLPSPTIRDWARKLIAFEVHAESTSAQGEGATLRVYEKLRRQFCVPLGGDAFQALVARALSVSKSEFPALSAVSVTVSGGLRGPGESDSAPRLDEDNEAGTLLIAQMLRLFIGLLGEAATVRLIEDAPFAPGIGGPLTTDSSTFGTGTNYLGPFKNIVLEADQLRHVSERLETLADTHVDIDELIGVAGNIRNIAAALDVFTLIRSKAGGSHDSVLVPPANGYLN